MEPNAKLPQGFFKALMACGDKYVAHDETTVCYCFSVEDITLVLFNVSHSGKDTFLIHNSSRTDMEQNYCVLQESTSMTATG